MTVTGNRELDMTTAQPSGTEPGKVTLEAASVDWRSARVQYTFGFVFILIAFALFVQEFFATRFLISEYFLAGQILADVSTETALRTGIPLAVEPLWTLIANLCKHHAWNYRVIAFVVSWLSALAVGLIAFSLTTRYGSRTGAAPAIFAALLFLVMPLDNALALPSTMLPSMVANLLALSAIWYDIRCRFLKEKTYFYVALLAVVLAGLLDVNAVWTGVLGIVLARLCLPQESRNTKDFAYSWAGISPCILIAILYITPHLVGGPAPDLNFVLSRLPQDRLVVRVFPILLATIFGIAGLRLLSGFLWLRPLAFAALWTVSSFILCQLVSSPSPGPISGVGAIGEQGSGPTGLFITPSFCILLALSAIPCIDTLQKRWLLLLTMLGSLVLSVAIAVLGFVLAKQVDEVYKKGKALSLFKIELARRLQSTGGKLVVVNPPFNTGTDTSLFPNKLETDRIDTEGTALLFGALLNSPLSDKPTAISIYKRLPVSLVRLENFPHNTNQEQARVTDYYAWSDETKQLMPVYYTGQAGLRISFQTNAMSIEQIKTQPQDILRIRSTEWTTVDNTKPSLESSPSGIRLNAGLKEDLVAWLSHESLDPTRVSEIKIDCARTPAKPIELAFKGTDSEDVSTIQFQPTKSGNQLIAVTKANPDWLKHQSIGTLGIKLSAGGGSVVLKSLESAAKSKNR